MRRRSKSRSTESCPEAQSNVQSLHSASELFTSRPERQRLYAFDGRKIALPGSDESTRTSLEYIHYHNDRAFEQRV